jgi:hypothetical protein
MRATMATKADNCMICSEEYSVNELRRIALSTVNTTRFKICNKCLNQADPTDDYRQVREIVSNFLMLDQQIDK